jgi:hypothetical protein
MLKKISADQIQLGMHLNEFCGSWMEPSFWRSGFILNDPKDIDSILASCIKEVWIDCDKGEDLAPGEIAVSEADSEAQVDAALAARGARTAQGRAGRFDARPGQGHDSDGDIEQARKAQPSRV